VTRQISAETREKVHNLDWGWKDPKTPKEQKIPSTPPLGSRPGVGRPRMDARRAEILAMVESGKYSTVDLAVFWGITHRRVNHLFNEARNEMGIPSLADRVASRRKALFAVLDSGVFTPTIKNVRTFTSMSKKTAMRDLKAWRKHKKIKDMGKKGAKNG